ncbi:MAG: glycosyltransferase [Planctomycetota bacterium]|nr:MAG: glycosyltransferase [Planctomycetota bacterium]
MVTPEGCCQPMVDYDLLRDVNPTTEISRYYCGDPAVHLKLWSDKPRKGIRKLAAYCARSAWKLLHNVSVPDSRICGIKRLYRLLSSIIKSQRIDVLWITGPPFSYFNVTGRLKRQFDIPVVLDLRDPWVPVVLRYPGLRRCYRPIERHMEKRAFGFSNRIILNTEGAYQRYLGDYPELDKSKWVVITNGYDAGELEAVPAKRFDRTVLVHGGWTGQERTSCFLIEAMGRLHREGMLSPETFKYICFSGGAPNERMAVKKGGVEKMVEFMGSRPHNEVLAAIRGADALLLLVGKSHKRQIPGKLYEYLGVGRPIIMAGPLDCDAAQIVRKTRTGTVLDIDDVDGFAKQLRDLIGGKTAEFQPDASAIAEYEAQSLSRKLAEVFEAVSC